MHIEPKGKKGEKKGKKCLTKVRKYVKIKKPFKDITI